MNSDAWLTALVSRAVNRPLRRTRLEPVSAVHDETASKNRR